MPPSPALPPNLVSRPGRALDVVCIGTALMDHLVFTEHADLERLGFTPGAMTLVDVAATEAIARELGAGRQVSGGTVANTAVGVASLGGRPAFVGAVATDELGARYAADLEAAGVQAILERLPAGSGPEAATGRCHVMVTPDAERTMATALGVSGRLDHGAIDADLLASAKLIYFDGYALDYPDAPELVAKIVEVAQAAETLLAFGLADPLVVERHHAALTQLLDGRVDLVFANEAEALGLTGARDAEEAIGALRRPGLVAVVTRGAAGAVVATEQEAIEVPAAEVEEVVDVTGAGDLFAAGVIFAVARGAELVEAAALGALCAAEIIGHLGARPEVSLAGLARSAGALAGSERV